VSADLAAWLRQQMRDDEGIEAAVLPGGRLHRAIGEGTVTINDARWIGYAESRVESDREAKLAILDEYEARDKDADLMLGPRTTRQAEWSGLWLAVRLIAVGYQQRRGYREEWKP
jgi:hypothetical protein